MNKISRPATFRAATELYHADTCTPLEASARRGEVALAALGRGSYPGEPLPKRDLREVCSLGVWDAHQDQDWGLDWHRNEGIELTYLASGCLAFGVDGRRFQLGPGSLTITRPWQRHRVGAPRVTASRLIWVILDVGVRRPNQTWRWPSWLLFDNPMKRRLTQLLSHNEQPVWRANRALAAAFESLVAEIGTPAGPTRHARLKVRLNDLWLELAGLLEQSGAALDASLSSSERTVRLFLAELAQRADEPWTLETMAAQCGIGRSCFSRHCRQLTNRTPIEHLTHCRLELAARLLRSQPERSVTDIAFACGFQSSQYFATVFARDRGCSPRAWRRKRWR